MCDSISSVYWIVCLPLKVSSITRCLIPFTLFYHPSNVLILWRQFPAQVSMRARLPHEVWSPSVQTTAKVSEQHSNSALTAENLCLQRGVRGPWPLSDRVILLRLRERAECQFWSLFREIEMVQLCHLSRNIPHLRWWQFWVWRYLEFLWEIQRVLDQVPNSPKQWADDQAKSTDTEAEPDDHLAPGLVHWDCTDWQKWAALRAGVPPEQDNQDILCEGTLSTGRQVLG